ncbi:MAG: hypothetical protein PHS48_03270 [Bacteroidales bacterium]|nr:hypothetical protein [Bacteroidales bacterium]
MISDWISSFPPSALFRFAGSFLLLLIIVLILFWHRIIPDKESRSIRCNIRRLRRSDVAYSVRISNRGKEPVEIESPRVVFIYKGIRRVFRVRPLGAGNLFPLCLYPGTHYQFIIDPQLFYEKDALLGSYSVVRLWILGRNHKILKRRKIKWQ